MFTTFLRFVTLMVVNFDPQTAQIGLRAEKKPD